MKIIVDVNQKRVKSAYCEDSLPEAKVALDRKGFGVISLEENARLRIQEGVDASVSQLGNWTREGFIYVPKKKAVYFTKNSPIMGGPEVSEPHRKEKKIFLTKDSLEKALISSYRVPFELPTNSSDGLMASIIDKGFHYSVPSLRLAEDGLTAFAFGKHAKEYGRWLSDFGINKLKFIAHAGVINEGSKPFCYALWFSELDHASFIGTYGNTYLMKDRRLRGIKKRK